MALVVWAIAVFLGVGYAPPEPKMPTKYVLPSLGWEVQDGILSFPWDEVSWRALIIGPLKILLM